MSIVLGVLGQGSKLPSASALSSGAELEELQPH